MTRTTSIRAACLVIVLLVIARSATGDTITSIRRLSSGCFESGCAADFAAVPEPASLLLLGSSLLLVARRTRRARQPQA